MTPVLLRKARKIGNVNHLAGDRVVLSDADAWYLVDLGLALYADSKATPPQSPKPPASDAPDAQQGE
jgi:hypothetical protein